MAGGGAQGAEVAGAEVAAVEAAEVAEAPEMAAVEAAEVPEAEAAGNGWGMGMGNMGDWGGTMVFRRAVQLVGAVTGGFIGDGLYRQ